MGYKLNKQELLSTCKHFGISVLETDTISCLTTKINSFYGKEYYKNNGNGVVWISSKNRSIIDKTTMSSKSDKPTGNKECPTCKKELPIKKFLNLNNRRLDNCNECRQKMGVK